MKLESVLLGTCDNRHHILFNKIAKAHKNNASINLKFDASLAQEIYASSDLFLIPSRYEPCGLGQMISFKYGAIPVVRQTGGLKDSVKEFDLQTRKGNGFTFIDYKPDTFFASIKKALDIYKDK